MRRQEFISNKKKKRKSLKIKQGMKQIIYKIEFKVLVIRILNKLGKRIGEHREILTRIWKI